MAGKHDGMVTFDMTTVRVHDGKAFLPGRYRHDFASIPDYWRTVETTSRYVTYPTLPPGWAQRLVGWRRAG